MEYCMGGDRHEVAFAKYEDLLRDYMRSKQQGAERFATAFAPKTTMGMWFRNLVMSAFEIPGLARLAVGSDIIDRVQLPEYRWQLPEPRPE